MSCSEACPVKGSQLLLEGNDGTSKAVDSLHDNVVVGGGGRETKAWELAKVGGI